MIFKTPTSVRGSRSVLSAAARAVTTAALVAACWSVSVANAEAAPITCGFGGAESTDPGCVTLDTSFNGFDFHSQSLGYSLWIDFQNVFGAFFITVNDVPMTQAEYAPRGRGRCVPIANGSNTCIDFVVEAPDSGDQTWFGNFQLDIFWDANTNGDYPDDNGKVRLLHNEGADPGDDFNDDITIPGSYCPSNCTPPAPRHIFDDPAISGLDNNFQSFTVAHIPEPATLLLLGAGIGGVLYRRRRS